MDQSFAMRRGDEPTARSIGNPPRDRAGPAARFDAQFADVFHAQFPRLFRYLDRLTGEPELASDLAQETFIRLHRRGSLPDAPAAWLVSVALNLFRNARSMRGRQRRLLTSDRMRRAYGDALPSPDQPVEAAETRNQVRAALAQLPEREGQLLLLRAEGFSYREIALALHLNEGSVGVLLARAKARFRESYTEAPHASR